MGDFGNEFDANLQIGIAVFVVMAAPTFGYFFNQWMDRLDDHEHTSYYVALGNGVTILLTALVSWKAALLVFVLFVLDGIPMIVGEFKRTERKKAAAQAKKPAPRRLRLPYAANGLLDECKMAAEEARRGMGKYLKEGTADLRVVEHELGTVIVKILEIQNIQK